MFGAGLMMKTIDLRSQVVIDASGSRTGMEKEKDEIEAREINVDTETA